MSARAFEEDDTSPPDAICKVVVELGVVLQLHTVTGDIGNFVWSASLYLSLCFGGRGLFAREKRQNLLKADKSLSQKKKSVGPENSKV